MSQGPMLNITIPVFNRFHFTQKTILALRRTRQTIPFVITVVDNGSEPELVDRLVAFRNDAIIDNLFLLPQNMGISCAANIGWRAVDTPFYMKLDNDILMKTPDWPERLFRLWRRGKALSTLGPARTQKQLLETPGALHTPDGILGICATNLQGQAIIIPREVRDALGMWSEDYGLYGAEDGDYGLRMNCADFPQYYYLSTDIYEDLGTAADIAKTYAPLVLDRKKEYATLFTDEKGGVGLFKVNNFLYGHCIRNWKVPLRYELADVDDNHRANVIERKGYRAVRRALEECKRLIDAKIDDGKLNEVYTGEFIEHLKKIMASCGQAC